MELCKATLGASENSAVMMLGAGGIQGNQGVQTGVQTGIFATFNGLFHWENQFELESLVPTRSRFCPYFSASSTCYSLAILSIGPTLAHAFKD